MKSFFLLVFSFLLTILTYAQRLPQRGGFQKPVLHNSIEKRNPATLPGQQSHTVSHGPVIRNMHQFRQSPQYSARKAIVGNTFNSQASTVQYPDGSKLHIKFVANPTWANQPPSITPQVSSQQPSVTDGLKCTSSRVTVNARTADFGVVDVTRQMPHIFPGAIYTFASFSNGSFKEENANRNPFEICTDLNVTNGNPYETITNPSDPNTIRAAISNLSRRLPVNPGTLGLTSQIFESCESADMSLKLTAGGSGYGISASNSFSMDRNEQHVYLTIDARKILYTLNTTPPENGFFKTIDEEKTANLLVISSVGYGVRVLANLDIKFKSQKDADEFKASYSRFGIKANADLDYLSKSSSVETKINAYVVGGPTNSTITFNKEDLKAEIQRIISQTNTSNAKPVSYQLMSMAGDVIGTESATDQFSVSQCLPTSKLIDAIVSIQTGDDDKDHDTHYTVSVYNKQNKLLASYSDNSDDKYDDRTTKEKQLKIANGITSDDISIANGGKVHIEIRPNGHDTWKVSSLKLVLNFENNIQKLITVSGLQLSQDSKSNDTFFNAQFNN